ncbi:Farnesyl pyrophosphate synthase [Apis cerana cerana]|uniref:Farnesyl pyrophosphate synthase n=1 Tax=Apis cerana cerana TaxID=94128 RepID=A0A2A3E1J4_APICC|nr:Farnesyl pyrophosphate synthase [Apis cerana cerana]
MQDSLYDVSSNIIAQFLLVTVLLLQQHISNNEQKYVNSFKDERNELMAMWPDIVRELTEEDNEELPDVKKWFKEILGYNVPKGGKRRSIPLVIAYKLLASQDQLTEENIRLALDEHIFFIHK